MCPYLRGRRHTLHSKLFAVADAQAGDAIHILRQLRNRQKTCSTAFQLYWWLPEPSAAVSSA